MLSNISKLGKVLKTLNRLEGIKEFNASLPIKIEVKSQLNPIRYKILLGKREIETKSYLPLEVGKKYIAEIKQQSKNIQITNLKPFPKLLETIENIDFKEELTHLSKEKILKHLSTSTNKQDFIFFSNLFFALTQHNIHHLVINDKRKALMQFKYQKNRVKFYALFTHLNELKGEITPEYVKIISPFSSTLSLIELYKDELNLKVYTSKDEIKPLYNFSENLINLKV